MFTRSYNQFRNYEFWIFTNLLVDQIDEKTITIKQRRIVKLVLLFLLSLKIRENSNSWFRNRLLDPVNKVIVIVWCWLLLPNCVLFHAAPVVSFGIISIEGEFDVLELCIPIQNSYLFVFTFFNYYCYFRLRLLFIHGAEILTLF